MEKKEQSGTSKAARGGDTSRSSSQGRKLSSGGHADRKGDPEMDDATHSPKAGINKVKRIGERKKPQTR